MKSIVCPRCGRRSYNVNDIRQRYCGHCHMYHDDMGENMSFMETYEYAGFKYEVVRNPDGTLKALIPMAGQHRAAYKERHRMAATQQFKEEHRDGTGTRKV
jgi:hypothetical protein